MASIAILHQLCVPASSHSPSARYQLYRFSQGGVDEHAVDVIFECGRSGQLQSHRIAKVLEIESPAPLVHFEKPLGLGAIADVCRMLCEFLEKKHGLEGVDLVKVAKEAGYA